MAAVNVRSIPVLIAIASALVLPALAQEKPMHTSAATREFTPNDTVGAIVAERLGRARVFERFGIDYCCGGKRTLAQAAAERRVDVAELIASLRQSDAAGESAVDPHDVGTLPPALLADHLLGTHHVFLRTELPRLGEMLERVLVAHGENHPEYFALHETWTRFSEDMYAHLVKEETGLFPAVKRFASEPTPELAREVRAAVVTLEGEHDEAGAALARMQSLTGGFTAPPDACNTLRALLAGLEGLERDTHQHVHEENNILFPMQLAAL